MTPFEELLKDLGNHLGTPLKPDSHQACRIDFSQGLYIQIDLQGNADAILIGSQLGAIPPGPFRDKVFTQALRINGLESDPRGVLAFSEKSENLILYQIFPIPALNGAKLAQFIDRFLVHAQSWHSSLLRGEIPQIEEGPSSTSPRPFGL